MLNCPQCGRPTSAPAQKFCTSCGAPLQQPAAQAPGPQPPQGQDGWQQSLQPPPGEGGWQQPSQSQQSARFAEQPEQFTTGQTVGRAEGASSRTAPLAWDITRVVLGFLSLSVAFGGTWHLVQDRDGAGPTALAVIGLIAAMVGLVVDVVLQRAVIGQDFDPLLRRGLRAVLVATLVIYSVYDLLHGEFQSISASDESFGAGAQHLWPLVGSGPVLALAGAGLVLIGPWKDRFSLPVALWRNIGAGVAGLAVIANGYQAIRGFGAANDQFDGTAAPIGLSITWFGMTVAAAVLTWALITGRRATWPVASLLVPSWVLAFAWQTALNTGVPGGSSEASRFGQLFKSFGTIGGGLLILAVVLAAAPLMASTAANRMSSRWIDGARGLAMTVAGSCLALVVLAGCTMSSRWIQSSSMDESGGADVDKGPLIWIIIMTLLVGVGAVIVWLTTRNPADGRLIGISWGVVAFLLVGITLLSSDSLTQMFTSDYLSLGRSSGFLPAAVLVLPLTVVAALVAPRSVREDYGSPITPAVRQRLSAAQQATAQRAEAAQQRAQQQAARQQQAYGGQSPSPYGGAQQPPHTPQQPPYNQQLPHGQQQPNAEQPPQPGPGDDPDRTQTMRQWPDQQ